MKEILVGVFTLILVGSLVYGGWLIKREINYSWDYESKVLETIQEQINPLELRIQTLEKEAKEISAIS